MLDSLCFLFIVFYIADCDQLYFMQGENIGYIYGNRNIYFHSQIDNSLWKSVKCIVHGNGVGIYIME